MNEYHIGDACVRKRLDSCCIAGPHCGYLLIYVNHYIHHRDVEITDYDYESVWGFD